MYWNFVAIDDVIKNQSGRFIADTLYYLKVVIRGKNLKLIPKISLVDEVLLINRTLLYCTRCQTILVEKGTSSMYIVREIFPWYPNILLTDTLTEHIRYCNGNFNGRTHYFLPMNAYELRKLKITKWWLLGNDYIWISTIQYDLQSQPCGLSRRYTSTYRLFGRQRSIIRKVLRSD
jgi:hypothetical protein